MRRFYLFIQVRRVGENRNIINYIQHLLEIFLHKQTPGFQHCYLLSSSAKHQFTSYISKTRVSSKVQSDRFQFKASEFNCFEKLDSCAALLCMCVSNFFLQVIVCPGSWILALKNTIDAGNLFSVPSLPNQVDIKNEDDINNEDDLKCSIGPKKWRQPQNRMSIYIHKACPSMCYTFVCSSGDKHFS